MQSTKMEIKSNSDVYQMRVRPYITEDKKIQGAVITIINITDLKKAEEELVFRSELLANVQDAVVAVDKNFNLIYWNKSAEDLFGWKTSEVVGRPYGELFQSELSEEAQKQALDDLLRTGYFEGETRYLCKDGKRITADVRSKVIRDKEGELKGVVSSFRDISERKLLEKRLEDHRKSLEQIVEERTKQLKDAERMSAIGTTAGMVGHDIRNPLQAITGDLYLAKLDVVSLPESEKKQSLTENLGAIEENIQYISKIINDLQDYVKPLCPQVEEINLKNIINEYLKKKALPDNVKIEVHVEPKVEKVLADSNFIKRILENLVSNAVQAMPNGGSLKIGAYTEGKDTVITVEDTGVGVPEEVKPKLFTPLFTTKSKGQGFGLAVVKRIAEACGGVVTFESEAGKGTKFVVRFPPQKKINGKLVYKSYSRWI